MAVLARFKWHPGAHISSDGVMVTVTSSTLAGEFGEGVSKSARPHDIFKFL